MNKRIYIITTEDPLYSVKIIEALYRSFGNSILEVGFSDGLITKKRIFLSPFLYGLVNYVALGLRVVLSSRSGGKIERFCRSNQIPVIHFTNVNSEDQLLKRMSDLNTDLLISVNCSKKLRSHIIKFPVNGVVNIHNSLLPKYRGLMPIVHCLANNEKEIGVTIHYIDDNLDTGKIISQASIPIEKGDGLFSLWKKAVDIGAEMLPKAINSIYEGNVSVKANDPKKGSYYSFATPSQIFRFRKNQFLNRFFRR